MSKNKKTNNYLMSFTDKELLTVIEFFNKRNKNFDINKEESSMNIIKKFLLNSIKIKDSFEKAHEERDYYKNENRPNFGTSNIETILLKISSQIDNINTILDNKKECEKNVVDKNCADKKYNPIAYFQFKDQEGVKTDLFTLDLFISSHFKSILNLATRILYYEIKFYYYDDNQLGFNSRKLNFKFDIENDSINHLLSKYHEEFENLYREVVQRDSVLEVKQEYLDVNRLLTTDIWYINENFIDYATIHQKIISVKTKEPYSKEIKIDCQSNNYLDIIRRQFLKYLRKD